MPEEIFQFLTSLIFEFYEKVYWVVGEWPGVAPPV